MSKLYFGIDTSSSTTGWSLIKFGDELSLQEYGLITPHGQMQTHQRLYFFGNELEKVIDKFKPDEIAIEETILVRGPKIMRTLARFSGVAIYKAYCYQKRDIAAYEPPSWKSKIGLSGHAKKPSIQLKICEIFKLLDQEKIEDYKKQLEYIETNIKNLRSQARKKIKEFEKLEKEFKRKSKADAKTKEEYQTKLKEEKDKIKEYSKKSKKQISEFEKKYGQISTDIYSDCGINPDIADSIGVALAKIKDDYQES